MKNRKLFTVPWNEHSCNYRPINSECDCSMLYFRLRITERHECEHKSHWYYSLCFFQLWIIRILFLNKIMHVIIWYLYSWNMSAESKTPSPLWYDSIQQALFYFLFMTYLMILSVAQKIWRVLPVVPPQGVTVPTIRTCSNDDSYTRIACPSFHFLAVSLFPGHGLRDSVSALVCFHPWRCSVVKLYSWRPEFTGCLSFKVHETK